MENNSRATLLHRGGLVVVSFATNALFFWQLRHPVLRFVSPGVNEVLGLTLAFSLPWLADATIFYLGRWWAKSIAVVLILPLLLYTFVIWLMMIMSGFAWKDGRDLSFDPFSETKWKGSVVRMYRTNGGATTDFGVVVRQERVVFPGVLIVRELDAFYHCYSLTIETNHQGVLLKDGRAQCRAFSDRQRNYRLKPFVYF